MDIKKLLTDGMARYIFQRETARPAATYHQQARRRQTAPARLASEEAYRPQSPEVGPPGTEGEAMKLTNAADAMTQKLGHIHTTEYLATIIGLAEQIAQAEREVKRVATWHIKAAMAEIDPMAPDYDALAAEEPATQNGDGRDAAEVAA